MENKKLAQNKSKNLDDELILPKIFIEQEPTRLSSKSAKSFESINSFSNDNPDYNNRSYKDNHKLKNVSFNAKIQVINIHNYKNETRQQYYSKGDEKIEKNIFKNKCELCSIF